MVPSHTSRQLSESVWVSEINKAKDQRLLKRRYRGWRGRVNETTSEYRGVKLQRYFV